jgi:hypothetical protein
VTDPAPVPKPPPTREDLVARLDALQAPPGTPAPLVAWLRAVAVDALADDGKRRVLRYVAATAGEALAAGREARTARAAEQRLETDRLRAERELA